MDDLISRSAVLNELIEAKSQVWKVRTDYAGIIDETIDIFANTINKQPAVDAAPKWISVEDEPPEENIYYLVSVRSSGNRGLYTDVAMYDGELWVRDAGAYFDILDRGEVTHYMPLPEPPTK